MRPDMEVDQALLDQVAAYNTAFQRNVRQEALVHKRAERALAAGNAPPEVDRVAQLLPDRRCGAGGGGGGPRGGACLSLLRSAPALRRTHAAVEPADCAARPAGAPPPTPPTRRARAPPPPPRAAC